MSCLMIGRVLFFFVAYHHTPPFDAHQYLVFSKLKINHIDFLFDFACSNKRCLVHKIGEVGPGKTGRPPCYLIKIDVLGYRDILCMDFEYFIPPFHIGGRHHYLPVESPGPQQRGIEDVRPVSSRNNDNSLVPLKTVHFNEQLVQGLFPLVMTASETSSPVSAHGIDFVNEYNTWRTLLRLLKKVTYAGGAYTNKHFNKIRA